MNNEDKSLRIDMGALKCLTPIFLYFLNMPDTKTAFNLQVFETQLRRQIFSLESEANMEVAIT